MRVGVFYFFCILILTALAVSGICVDSTAFVGSLFAAFLSVFVVVFVEMELRPRIRITIEPAPVVLPDGRRFLRVLVENRRLWWPLNFIMDRRPVYQARAWITFLTETGDPVFTRRMIGRWSNTPEPIRPIAVSQSSAEPGTVSVASLWDLSITRDFIDIGSGNSEPLDIVARSPRRNGCFGWNNRMISNPNPAPEDVFELPRGRYHVSVLVEASGRSTTAVFRIVCDVGITDFRLEPLRS